MKIVNVGEDFIEIELETTLEEQIFVKWRKNKNFVIHSVNKSSMAPCCASDGKEQVRSFILKNEGEP